MYIHIHARRASARTLSRVRGVGSVKWTQERRTRVCNERKRKEEVKEEKQRRRDSCYCGGRTGVVRFVDVRERSSHIDRG